MHAYPELLSVITEQLKSTHYGQQPAELYDPIYYMMDLGGKRLRPVLTLMGCELFSESYNQAIPAALSVEIFHNFTLVHDDIMDNAPLRRGKETIYKKWNMPVAILSGDLMLIKAVEILCSSNQAHVPALMAEFTKVAAEVCEGQQFDMNFESRLDVTHDEYIRMITLKTAVLLGSSLKMGAIAGGASGEDANNLYEFGKNIGIAFQIQDDILDSFGDGDKVGKRIGGDIDSWKKTLLLIELYSCVHKDDRKHLDYLMTAQTELKVKGVLELYAKYQIRQFAEMQKQQYLDKAFGHLENIKTDASRKQILIATARDLMERMS